jgi:hypothetical protein
MDETMLTILGERRQFAGEIWQNLFVVVKIDGDKVSVPITVQAWQ